MGKDMDAGYKEKGELAATFLPLSCLIRLPQSSGRDFLHQPRPG